MRGKDGFVVQAYGGTGITPACAGKSLPAPAGHSPIRDHPRVCGEKVIALRAARQILGSPPRVRGKDDGRLHVLVSVRITPACAGKSSSPISVSSDPRDHPRVCGEKAALPGISWTEKGSPPRVRGKVRKHRSVIRELGITPACAGKRDIQSSDAVRLRDHPRVCGEKRTRPCDRLSLVGSPPRVRGKAQGRRAPAPRAGITPACAGKREPRSRTKAQSEDHPRVCGEKADFALRCRGDSGSPPRVRGKGSVWVSPAEVGGITPACAGKRSSAERTARRPWDHPRVCGEKTKKGPKVRHFFL